MSSLATALTYARLLEESAVLRLLRSGNAAVTVALLSEHLSAPGARIPCDELHELVDIDLEALRDHVDLPQTGRKYCDDWRNAGFLVRRPAVDARGETYELSADALVGIRLFQQLESPRTTVAESRLVSLASAVRQLAIDTDPDVTRRLEALAAERERIDAEVARLEAGEVAVLDARRAVERIVDILLQAQDLPADFAGVRARFESLNHDLRTSILDTDISQSTVLDDIFRGVDLIESSDEGRTFTAFSALLRDPERSSALDADVAAVLSRDFTHALLHLFPGAVDKMDLGNNVPAGTADRTMLRHRTVLFRRSAGCPSSGARLTPVNCINLASEEQSRRPAAAGAPKALRVPCASH